MWKLFLFQNALSENVEYILDQQLLISGLSLGLIVVMAIIVYISHKRHPDEEVGLVVQRSWYQGKSLIVIAMVFLICLFEAGTAAMISTSNESTTSTFARFGMHLVIGFMSMFCVIIATFFVHEGIKEHKTIKNKMAAIKAKGSMEVVPRRALSHWLMIPVIGLVYFMSIWFGYINIELIAKSAGDYTRFHEYVTGSFWVWEFMDNNTALSISVGYAHGGILILDVIIVLVLTRSSEGLLSGKDGKTINDKINDKETKEKEKKGPDGALEFLLKRMNFAGPELERTVKILRGVLEQRQKSNKTQAGEMLSQLNALYDKYKKFDAEEWDKLSKVERSKHKNEAAEEIRAFFKKGQGDGGFGTNLKLKAEAKK